MVLLPGKSHGQRSLWGYSAQGHRVRHKTTKWESCYKKESLLESKQSALGCCARLPVSSGSEDSRCPQSESGRVREKTSFRPLALVFLCACVSSARALGAACFLRGAKVQGVEQTNRRARVYSPFCRQQSSAPVFFQKGLSSHLLDLNTR